MLSDDDYNTESCGDYPDYCKTISFRDANGVVKQLVFPKALDLDRPKRARTTFSNEQLDSLEEAFKTSQYLVGKERMVLSGQLGLSETQVKVWFQNRRTKHKKDQEKKSQATDASAESRATKSVLKMLEYKSSAPLPTLPPTAATLEPRHPEEIPPQNVTKWNRVHPPFVQRAPKPYSKHVDEKHLTSQLATVPFSLPRAPNDNGLHNLSNCRRSIPIPPTHTHHHHIPAARGPVRAQFSPEQIFSLLPPTPTSLISTPHSPVSVAYCNTNIGYHPDIFNSHSHSYSNPRFAANQYSHYINTTAGHIVDVTTHPVTTISTLTHS